MTTTMTAKRGEVQETRPTLVRTEPKRVEAPQAPSRVIPTYLEFTPYAWAKLQWLVIHCPGEVGGFGVTADPTQPLLVTDIAVPKQRVSTASVELDDDEVARWFDGITQTLEPWQVMRVWIHTHPTGLDRPSGHDEQVMAEVFGRSDYYIALIITKDQKLYCQLRSNVGRFSLPCSLGVRVRWDVPFPAGDPDEWKAERDAHVTERHWEWPSRSNSSVGYTLSSEKDDPIRRKVEQNEAPTGRNVDLKDDLDPEEWEMAELAAQYGVGVSVIRQALAEGVNVLDETEWNWWRWAYENDALPDRSDTAEDAKFPDEWNEEFIQRRGDLGGKGGV